MAAMNRPDHSSVRQPFEQLTPDFIIDAVETMGYSCDGRVFGLNSYENRVYQIGMTQGQPIIAKFYRPNRWSDDQIIEEHDFAFDLEDAELPVVAPVTDDEGCSLFWHEGFRFALYPRKGGHAPELDNLDNLLILGRLLGRMHEVGSVCRFEHRPAIDVQSFGYDSVALISEQFMPDDLRPAYDGLAQDLLQMLDEAMSIASQANLSLLRVHGDCHVGNMLWRDDNPHFVDFDDARMAPAIQDIWMLLSGESDRQQAQLDKILTGYRQFRAFDTRELALIEPLRTLRIMYFAAWLARRWQEPAFQLNFPWFNTQGYWQQHVLDLREQYAALQQPPLSPTIY